MTYFSPLLAPNSSATNYLNPLYWPAVDSIWLGGEQAPGKWTLRSAPRVYDWQVVLQWSMEGGALLPKCVAPMAIEFLVELFDDPSNQKDYYLEYMAFRSKWLKRPSWQPGGSSKQFAIPILHPELNFRRVNSVVIAEENPLVNDGSGLWSCTVKFIQWMPFRAMKIKPDAAYPSDGGVAATDQESARNDLLTQQQANAPVPDFNP